MFKTPSFWQSPNIIALALSPFSIIYLLIFFVIKFCTKSHAVKAKILCVGNLTVGGQGKTPCAIAIAKICDDLAIEYAFLSRGYRGKFNEELYQVNKNDLADKVGDEPILLSHHGSTFIAKNRYIGAKILSDSNKYQLLIFDDGLQNNSLKKDLKIVVIDEKIMFGNNLPLPAGPLREPVKSGLNNANLIIYVGKKINNLPKILESKKVIFAEVEVLNFKNFIDKKIIAFCGIAYPQKFYKTLQDCNLDVIKTVDFDDHHHYSQKDLEALEQNLQQFLLTEKNAILLTTKKDWVKFPPQFQAKISYLDIALKFADEKLLKIEIKKILEIANE